MENSQIKVILEKVSSGEISPADALKKLRVLPFVHTENACIDTHRSVRCGFPEVIYCPGKSTGEIVQIFRKLYETGVNILATRAEEPVYQAVRDSEICPREDLTYDPRGRTITLMQDHYDSLHGDISVVTAGTADVPVGREALATCLAMGQNAELIADVGVAGIHRLLSRLERIRKSNVVIVAAGMEGALASVVAGLVDVPVIGVPTSVGYGSNFGGLSALLTMLNSCANGVSVVNIDNGFSAGYTASLINRNFKRSDE
ncbi:nickel pincer cofactor biosynthesis protein LarB [Sedimentisphaera salicampi]|uniref:Phosphoribosylaminoimidazole carboxylase, catalytic subunit n=1 Tax=Sedimentisphaera salicampi TaxID=1941349 RepID=A0A1W6LJU6_9BACT|nr:nickel pincer cofactor biosynthesis protein LarB [Sedimentisphaera salicampi]ARN56039.1 phosphoribosylaminoimidazole carboxylase, catalytic subunit [Sedimentisphaera salicampi]OXU15772.1 phosphoribosylaminoimidazole carboxylase, catalytic subunit [Sedimentisphaera salicampi]